MADIKELQTDIRTLVEQINSKHNHSHPELISHLKVIEELGEITKVLLSTQIKSRKNDKLDKAVVAQEMGEEIADAIIALLSLANDFNVDMSDIILGKLEKHKQRSNSY